MRVGVAFEVGVGVCRVWCGWEDFGGRWGEGGAVGVFVGVEEDAG